MPPGALRSASRRSDRSAIELLEALRDGREVLFVAGDQVRVGFGDEAVGKVKRAGSKGVHDISSDPKFVTLDPKFGAHESGWTLL
jgi:hypothetical protein